MEILQPIPILRHDNQYENASVVQLTRELARDDIDRMWWDDADLSNASIKEGDSHWRWERIVNDYSHDTLHACVAVLSQEGYLEGAMAYQFHTKSKLEVGAGCVYIGWLATAPRNRDWLVNQTQYKGIGSVLTYWAVRESYSSGLGGRIFLQSLPTPRTLQFYKKKGFIRTDWTQPETGLIDHELPTSAAIAWLKKEGDL